MIVIDTHTHMYAPQFDEDRDEVIQKAIAGGVKEMYLPNIDSTSIDSMLALEKAYPENCFAMMGLHPCSVNANFQEELAIVKEWLDKRSFCAVGEIGIDLYWDKTFFEQQKEAFLIQIEWAKALNLPIVIHSRDATDVIIEILKTVKDEQLKGIFHCFTGDVRQANKIIDLGFLLGIGGVVTFKNAGLDKTVKEISLKHIVLETDSPYLAPKPFRGKRNESGYVLKVLEKVATLHEVSEEEVAELTTANAKALFTSSVSA